MAYTNEAQHERTLALARQEYERSVSEAEKVLGQKLAAAAQARSATLAKADQDYRQQAEQARTEFNRACQDAINRRTVVVRGAMHKLAEEDGSASG